MFQLLRKIWSLLSHRERYSFFLLLLMMVIGAALELAGIGLVFPLIATLSDPSLVEKNDVLRRLYRISGAYSNEQFLLRLCILMCLLFVVKNTFLAALIRAQSNFVFRKAASMSSDLFERYLNAPYSYHLHANSASLMSNINLIGGLASNHLLPFMLLLAEVVVIVAIFLLLVIQYPLTTLVIGGLAVGLGALIYYPLKRKQYALGVKINANNKLVTQVVMQGLEGIKEAKLRNCEDFFSTRHAQFQTSLKQAVMLAYFNGQIPRFFLESLVVCGGTGILGGFVMLGYSSADIIIQFSQLMVAMFRLMPSFSRVQYYLSTIRSSDCVFEEVYHDLTALPTEVKITSAPPFQLKQEIRIENVTFAYPGGSQLFPPLTFAVPRFSSVALVGPTGCGKTTLANLMLGLLKPAAGRILVDGRNIEENLPSWQRRIGYVPQFIFLLDDSIRNNVAFGVSPEMVDEGRVRECLQLAQILEFVEGQAEGIHTLAGERGVRLSGGQRQRIGIARALYHRPEVLVLDEATSALDHETEEAFIDALNALSGSFTIIMIAHRLTTVEKCNQIIDFKRFGGVS